MRDKKGSVLTVTLALVVVFLMLGLATMHFTSVQNEIAESRLSSMQAFWLADAGIEIARAKLQKTVPELIPQASPMTGSLGDGIYSVYSEQDKDCYEGDPDWPACPPPYPPNRWHIRSQASVSINNVDGTVNTQSRGIDAIVAEHDISNAITTHGTVNGSCVSGGSATITGDCAANVEFSFSSILGMTFAELVAEAASIAATIPPFPAGTTHEFHLSSSSQPFEVGGVAPDERTTVVFLEGNLNKLTVNTDDSSIYLGPTLLIIDGRSSPDNKAAEITINGTVGLCGIIWTIGEATINGNSIINGAIFIDGDPLTDNPVLGNTRIAFDPACVQAALGSLLTGDPRLISWKEYAL